MPAWRFDEGDRGCPAAVPRLESIHPFIFSAADGSATPDDLSAGRELWAGLNGPAADDTWLREGPVVSHHDMVRAVARRLGSELLSEVDLIVTVAAGSDWRHQSLPGPVLADLAGSDPLIVGISEQGVAGPFTALRIAAGHLAAGSRRRALVVLMEQSTLPPCATAARPERDAAVALLLGTLTGPELGRVEITVTDRAAVAPRHSAPPPAVPPAGTLLAGAGLGDLTPADGITLLRGEPGLPVTGLWLTLAHRLTSGEQPAGRLLVADRDPVLPYLCGLPLTWAGPDRDAGNTASAVSASSPDHAPKELVP
ncbi:hypothetical protein PJ985_00070 [Streptomyces sp. ACA25]|uniref:hypothetical protein n=1 Tax=Streptomyces sp. ACA25 TaxID=3022596 RepID=UPI0023072E13|nr:hypothetical protein [Streptomyces sp. ACA25]MDB1085984.1 hypothetical protein [Streptomyces sp. ACA25]